MEYNHITKTILPKLKHYKLVYFDAEHNLKWTMNGELVTISTLQTPTHPASLFL